MVVETKLVNESYFGYVKIQNVRIYAIETKTLIETLEGLKNWLVVQKHITIFC